MRSSFNENSLMEARSGKCMFLPYTNIISRMWSQYYLWAAGKWRLSTASPCLQLVNTRNKQSACLGVGTVVFMAGELRRWSTSGREFMGFKEGLLQGGILGGNPTGHLSSIIDILPDRLRRLPKGGFHSQCPDCARFVRCFWQLLKWSSNAPSVILLTWTLLWLLWRKRIGDF